MQSKRTKANRKNVGFTITELLLVVAILGVVLSAVTVSVSASMHQYRSAMRRAQTDILYSTLYEAITAELRSGTDFVLDDDTNELKSYHSKQMNLSGNITDKRTDENGNVIEGTEGMLFVGGQPMVSKNAYQDGIKAKLQTITYDKDKQVFVVTLDLQMEVAGEEDYIKTHTFQVSPMNRP